MGYTAEDTEYTKKRGTKMKDPKTQEGKNGKECRMNDL